MSFDKQNFARSIKEQQSGISPQMWPIICPDNGHLVQNHPYEIAINPCDSIWLPATYDKSYGVNPVQLDSRTSQYFPGAQLAGCNVWDVKQVTKNPNFSPVPINVIVQAPCFGLRFNSPNNPWLLWGLQSIMVGSTFGPSAQGGLMDWGRSAMMRAISGPISRLWIQWYSFVQYPGFSTPVGANQIVLMSMLGYSQMTLEQDQSTADPAGILTAIPQEKQTAIICGGYRMPDLNTADLNSLGSKTPLSPPASTT
jgi:hypothetical protein